MSADPLSSSRAEALEAQVSAAFFSYWRSRLSQPIVRFLLLSLSLHLLLPVLVRPEPGSAQRGSLVIHARLAMQAPRTANVSPKLPPKSQGKTVPPAPLTPMRLQPVVVPPSLSHIVSPTSAPLPHPLPLPSTAPAPQPTDSPKTNAVSVAQIKQDGSTAVGTAQSPETSSPLSIDIDANWYLARQVDVHARAIGNIVPEYPDEARRRNQEGTLKLMVKIDDLGRVREVEVIEADLPGVFEQAALDAFRQAHFQPAMKDGHPVRYQAYIRVTFKLH